MGTRSEVIDTILANTRIRRGLYKESMKVTTNLTSGGGTAFTIAQDMPPVLVLGASAARNIRLPAGSAAIDGLQFTIVSRSTTTTGVLTLQTSTGAALSPATTIVQGGSRTVIYLHGIGWKPIGIHA